jgi:hypothetical protein
MEKMKLLQINYSQKSTGAPSDKVHQFFLEGAKKIAEVNGLQWKIWIMNGAEQLAGGIYLFKDEASAQAYLNGPIIAATKSMPGVSNFESKIFDVIPDLTKITRGPV